MSAKDFITPQYQELVYVCGGKFIQKPLLIANNSTKNL